MIAVTCRNGENFTLDPDAIARIEQRGDVAVFLEDGTHYVIGESFDELLRRVREHRAAAVSRRRLLVGRGNPGPVPDRPHRLRSDQPVALVPAP